MNSNGKNPSDGNNPGFIPTHGGYRKLFSYQKSEIVFDATVHFCNRFFQPRLATGLGIK